ncbi:c6 finger domain-containing [Trichoderma arundinaceum]|uniref:C6 finger domain-containing n=1 Tax=Trichoderma arundinaceum TaxID=490622 RepID=A0A395NCB6_TRIAR|nr:c6 finger domain-containing [Trichoderma arundinaceum]
MLEPRIGISDGSVLPCNKTIVSNFTIDSFAWDSFWDIQGPELDFPAVPHTTPPPVSHLGTGDLKYLGETALLGNTLAKQFQPASEENVRTGHTSILHDDQLALLGRYDTSERDDFRLSSFRSTGVQPNQLVLADFSFVPMLHDADRWTFCANKMVSYIGTFSKTASTDFITPYNLQSPLTAALGLCAAHMTLTGSGRVILDKLIEAEIDNLIWYVPQRTTLSVTDLSTCGDVKNCFTPTNDLQFFREELARVQAMTLYQIMRSFASDATQRRQAAQHEPLLAAWTTSLQERIHKLLCTTDQNIPNRSVSSFSALIRPEQSAWGPANGHYARLDDCTFDSGPLREDELESAHRTILISYFVRAIFAVVTFGICPLISELESLMVSVPASVRGRRQGFGAGKSCSSRTFSPLDSQACDDSRLSYKELLALWEQGFMSTSDLEDDYTQLLLVACKGVGVLSRGTDAF